MYLDSQGEEEKTPDYYEHSGHDSLNHRIETYHLENLSDHVIEEKAEEEEASTVQVNTNKQTVEAFSTLTDCYEDDIRIMEEDSVSRRSINTSQINIKRTNDFGNNSFL